MVCKQEPPGAKPFLPGLLKYQIFWQGNVPSAVKAANVLHFRWSDSVNHPLSDLTNLMNQARTQTNLHWLPHISSNWSIIGTQVSSLGGDGNTVNETAVNPGTTSSLPLPPQCTVAVSWRSGIVARGGRGRTYLPGIPDSATIQIGSPVVTSTYAQAVLSDMNAWIIQITALLIGGVSPVPVIPSYYHNCQLRPTPLVFPIQTAVVHDRLDSQRRRSGKEASFPIG